MDGTGRQNTKWNRPDADGQILHETTYRRDLKYYRSKFIEAESGMVGGGAMGRY